jgi:hypothetical protein
MRLLDFAGLRDVADCAVLAHGGSHLALSSLIACFRDALVFGYPDHWRRIRYLRSCFAPDAPGFLNYPQLVRPLRLAIPKVRCSCKIGRGLESLAGLWLI